MKKIRTDTIILVMGMVIVSLGCGVSEKQPVVMQGTVQQADRTIKFSDKFYDVVVVGETDVWVVGYFGAVLHSGDGGKTWTRKGADVGESLLSVGFANENEGWITGDGGLILHTRDKGESWERQECPTPDQKLLKMQVLNNRESWIVGSFGTILHTADGGKTWEQQPYDEDVILNDICMVNPEEGWIAGEYETILHTTEGGNTWERQYCELYSEAGKLFGIAFADGLRGIAVGTRFAVLMTEDGGVTWTSVKCPLDDVLLRVRFVDDTRAVAVGLRGCISNTQDSGKTWSDACLPYHTTWLSGMAFTPQGRGVLVGDIGLKGNMCQIVGGQYALYNNAGEYLADKYCADFECDIDIGILIGMEKEVMEGKGPIRFEPSQFTFKNPLAVKDFLFKWDRSFAKRFWKTLFAKENKYMLDHAPRPEVIQSFIGECSCVRVDHGMRTSLDGLWALGDTSHGGGGGMGRRIRGAALMYTAASSLLAGPPVVDFVRGSSEGRIDEDQVKRFKKEIYAPMEHKTGISPRDLIFDLKEVVAPPRYGIRKSKERLEEAIDKLKSIRERGSEVTPSGDCHMLGLCHDLKNMLLCAELYFNAALTRTETRGWHYREDLPERDDKNWLKWIILKQQDNVMTISTEDIPIERYKSRPKGF